MKAVKREYGRGVKIGDRKRGRKFYRVNVVAGQIHDEGGVRRLAPLCCQGTMNAVRFEERFENGLLKAVKKGKTVIMDRASFHRRTRPGETCKEHEVFLLLSLLPANALFPMISNRAGSTMLSKK
jgi:hypothetical protein